MNEEIFELTLTKKELKRLYGILKWVNIATIPTVEERKMVEEILFKIRKLDHNI